MPISVQRFTPGWLLRIAIATVAICAAAPAESGSGDKVINAGGQAIVVPADTAMQHWRKLSEAGMSGARFSDKVSLTGTLYYFGSSPGAAPDSLRFEPDRASAARLPYLKADGKPPPSFGVELPGKAAAFPASLRKAADASKGKKVVAAPASLSITGYLLFEDGCGANEYQVEGATLDRLGPMQLAAPPRGDKSEGQDC